MEYENPAVTVDNIILKFDKKENELMIYLKRREIEPFKGQLALIGGFISKVDMTVNKAVERILQEKMIKDWRKHCQLNQSLPIYCGKAKERDPRGWVMTVPNIIITDDFEDENWIPLNHIIDNSIQLAFDHRELVMDAVQLIKKQIINETFEIIKCLIPIFNKEQLNSILSTLFRTNKKQMEIETKNFARDLKRKNKIQNFKNSSNKKKVVGRPLAEYQWLHECHLTN